MKKLFFILVVAVIGFSFTSESEKDRGLLVVTVLDDAGNIIEGVEVTVFETEEDHTNKTNGIGPVKSNENGKAKFKELKLIGYYIWAEKGNMNNLFGAEKTIELVPNKYNRVNVIITE